MNGLNRTPKIALMDLMARPLRFGDEDQIQCVYILGLAEQLTGTAGDCRECGGTGEVEDDEPGTCDKCGKECSHCEGESLPCDECDDDGMQVWRRDEVYAMSAESIIKLLNVVRSEPDAQTDPAKGQ